MSHLVSYKTEINPTPTQIQKINNTIGVVRFLKNMFISHNIETYNYSGKFISADMFDKWLTNTYLPLNPNKMWIKDVSSKSRKQGLRDTEKAYKRFFKGTSKYPTFKKKNKNDVKMYFVKTDKNRIISCDRHRIKVPTIGWVKIKEKGYIPQHDENHIIKSGKISKQADRYYISVLVEQSESFSTSSITDISTKGIGIDLGIKDFAIFSDSTVYKNINKSLTVKKLERKLIREQRKLSRKYEALKIRKLEYTLEEGEVTRQNIHKQLVKVQKVHQTLTNIREDYQNKIVSKLVKTKPAYITLEDLNVKGMMKNRHLSKAIQKQSFYTFKEKIVSKAILYNIEVREVDRFYPSSKTCNSCGEINRNLKLSDRIYKCGRCGYIEDRDINASMNLRDALEYKVIA